MALRIVQQLEDVLGLLIKHVGESVKEVTNCYDDVGLHSKINVRVQECEKKVNIGNADLGGHAHELAESQDCRTL
jgi:hypothetical protein